MAKQDTYLNEDEGRRLELTLHRNGLSTFIERIYKADKSELDFEMSKLAKTNEMITNTMKSDSELKVVAEKAKNLRRPYNDQKRENAKLIRYVSLVLEERYGSNLGLHVEEDDTNN